MSDQLVDRTAERAALGALMLTPALAPRLREIVRDVDFYDPVLALLWRACCAVYDRGLAPDMVLLRAELVAMDAFQRCWSYVADIGDEYLTTLSIDLAEDHARAVARYGAMRRVDGFMATARRALRGGDPASILARLHAEITREMERGSVASGLRTLKAHVADAEAAIMAATEGHAVVMPTGLECLDGSARHIGYLGGGLFPGDVAVLAAPPGGGKTTLLQQFVHSIASAGHRVAWWSLEMPGRQVLMREAALGAGIATGNLLTGCATPDQMNAVWRRMEEWSALPVEMSCETDTTVDDIASAVMSKPADKLPRLIAVDYLGLMRHASEMKRRDLHEQVDAIVVGLKRLAMRAGVAVVLLAQFNRDANKGQGRFTMHDLKGGGAIEAHADIVLLLQRANGDASQVLEVAKARTGATGEQEIRFDRDRGRIVEVFRADTTQMRAFAGPMRSVTEDAEDAPAYGGMA